MFVSEINEIVFNDDFKFVFAAFEVVCYIEEKRAEKALVSSDATAVYIHESDIVYRLKIYAVVLVFFFIEIEFMNVRFNGVTRRSAVIGNNDGFTACFEFFYFTTSYAFVFYAAIIREKRFNSLSLFV